MWYRGWGHLVEIAESARPLHVQRDMHTTIVPAVSSFSTSPPRTDLSLSQPCQAGKCCCSLVAPCLYRILQQGPGGAQIEDTDRTGSAAKAPHTGDVSRRAFFWVSGHDMSSCIVQIRRSSEKAHCCSPVGPSLKRFTALDESHITMEHLVGFVSPSTLTFFLCLVNF